LHELTVRNELLRLDQEWRTEQERYMGPGRPGPRPVASLRGTVVGGVIVVVVGLARVALIIWPLMASSGSAGGPPALLPPVFLIFLVLFVISGGITNYRKARAYQRAEEEYQRRRRALLDRLGPDTPPGGGPQEASTHFTELPPGPPGPRPAPDNPELERANE